MVTIEARVANGVPVLDLRGRLTAEDRPGLLRDAVSAAARSEGALVILNLADMHYIDSTRLGELIGAHVTLSRDGKRLVLVATPDRVRDLLRLAGLDTIFEQFETIEHAARGGRDGRITPYGD
jgi:anti-sigma B factor antagonist